MALVGGRVAAVVLAATAAAVARADTPSVDLTVTALSGAPATAPAGSSFTVSSTVKTTGAVTRSFTVGLYLSTDTAITTADTLVGSRTVASLARNASSTATTYFARVVGPFVPPKFPPGIGRIRKYFRIDKPHHGKGWHPHLPWQAGLIPPPDEPEPDDACP